MLSAMTSVFAPEAAGIVGTWNTDVAAGLSLLDEGAAALLAGNPDIAGKPIPLDVAFARIHPDDREWVFAWVRHVREIGGPVAAEFRVLTASGEIRWILNRGHLHRDATGVMRGHGTYIDTTDAHRALAPPDVEADTDPLHQAADHCMRAHAAIRRSGDTHLALMVDMLLLEIGCVLARRSRP
ncbi:diguanylate cyclase [Methylobacterium sp. Leaf87]|nr:diguanylate cyclase [Methylobacterium sp. Leaf87]